MVPVNTAARGTSNYISQPTTQPGSKPDAVGKADKKKQVGWMGKNADLSRYSYHFRLFHVSIEALTRSRHCPLGT